MEKHKYSREQDKAREVAKEYTRKGFKVTLEPTASELPKALRHLGFRPDIIATSGDIKLVIEIKTFQSIQDSKVAEIANKVNSIEGWDFELVYTNPKSKIQYIEKNESNSSQDATSSIDRAARFIGTNAGLEYSDAALFLAWSAVEQALRTAITSYNTKNINMTPKALVRDSVMFGIIGKEEQHFLDTMIEKRNKFAHGIFDSEITQEELNKLIEVGREITRQIA